MKKGIECWIEYDSESRWCMKIKKARGKFTLDEIIETAREYGQDFYLLLIDAYHDEEAQCWEDTEGDFVTLYRTDAFQEE